MAKKTASRRMGTLDRRGMTWNVMCAACHNTGCENIIGEARIPTRPSMAEMSVGCEACHGPMADHNVWQAKHPKQKGDPNRPPAGPRPDVVGLRFLSFAKSELTGDFVRGSLSSITTP